MVSFTTDVWQRSSCNGWDRSRLGITCSNCWVATTDRRCQFHFDPTATVESFTNKFHFLDWFSATRCWSFFLILIWMEANEIDWQIPTTQGSLGKMSLLIDWSFKRDLLSSRVEPILFFFHRFQAREKHDAADRKRLWRHLSWTCWLLFPD